MRVAYSSEMKRAAVSACSIGAALALAACGGSKPVERVIQDELYQGARNVQTSDCTATGQVERGLKVYRCRFHTGDNFINEWRCYGVRGDTVEPILVGNPPRPGCRSQAPASPTAAPDAP